jgi:hypothetical protein
MKRYSISYAREVNKQASKSGIAYQYMGRTDNPEEAIESFKDNAFTMGIKITDSKTKKVVFEELRTIKGQLILTLKDGRKCTFDCYNLAAMRKAEHTFIHMEDVENVERIILPKN